MNKEHLIITLTSEKEKILPLFRKLYRKNLWVLSILLVFNIFIFGLLSAFVNASIYIYIRSDSKRHLVENLQWASWLFCLVATIVILGFMIYFILLRHKLLKNYTKWCENEVEKITTISRIESNGKVLRLMNKEKKVLSSGILKTDTKISTDIDGTVIHSIEGTFPNTIHFFLTNKKIKKLNRSFFHISYWKIGVFLFLSLCGFGAFSMIYAVLNYHEGPYGATPQTVTSRSMTEQTEESTSNTSDNSGLEKVVTDYNQSTQPKESVVLDEKIPGTVTTLYLSKLFSGRANTVNSTSGENWYYFATAKDDENASPKYYLFVSTNQGASYKLASTGNTEGYTTMNILNGHYFLLFDGQRFYHSVDGGYTWLDTSVEGADEEIKNGFLPDLKHSRFGESIEVNATNAKIYFSNEKTKKAEYIYYYTEDGGASWQSGSQ